MKLTFSLLAGLLLLLFPIGCAGTQPLDAPLSARMVCVVPGAAGAGWYGGFCRSLVDCGFQDLRVFKWGAPIFVLNLQEKWIHDAAEKELAEQLATWIRQSPGSRIDVVAHSAGCGVALGALARLGPDQSINTAIILAPSVSPGYDLVPVLRHVKKLHHFYSDKDVAALKWRTGTFGTYDNVKTPAAGHTGFQPQSTLPPDLASRLVQHPYDPAWSDLGNDGSHVGPISREFVTTVVAPLLR